METPQQVLTNNNTTNTNTNTNTNENNTNNNNTNNMNTNDKNVAVDMAKASEIKNEPSAAAPSPVVDNVEGHVPVVTNKTEQTTEPVIEPVTEPEPEPEPVQEKEELSIDMMYVHAYDTYYSWALQSMDLIKSELLSLCFPIFVHWYV